MDIPNGTAEKIKQLVKDFDCMIYKCDEYKRMYYNSEADATNLTGELVTVSAENEELKQRLKFLKAFIKKHVKVNVAKENFTEHDGCLGCKFQIESELGFPCKKCKGAVSPLSEEYETRKDYWSET